MTGVAIDLGWFRYFNSLDPELQMFQRFQFTSPGVRSKVLERVYADTVWRRTAQFLEQVVVNEVLYVDRLAAQTTGLQLPDALKGIVVYKAPTREDYAAVEATVTEEVSLLMQLSREVRVQLPDDLQSMDDENYHDVLFKEHAGLGFADTTDSLQRALFYIAFSERLGVVPFLSDGKVRWYESIGAAVTKTMHEVLSQRIDAIVLGELDAEMARSTAVTEVPLPPVAEWILRKSVTEATSPLEAALTLRESPAAASYRKLLVDLTGSAARGRAGLLEQGKALASLDAAAKEWGAHFDPALGVGRQQRTLQLAKLPVIGWLLKLAEMDKVKVRDWVIAPKPNHIAFVSSWYRTKG